MILLRIAQYIYLEDFFSNSFSGDIVRNIGWFLGAVFGLPFLVWRSYVAHRQVQVAEQGQITERFSRAIEGLGATRVVKRAVEPYRREDAPAETSGVVDVTSYIGSGELLAPNVEVRLGSIYALERVSRDSPEDFFQIIETLCAYIRGNISKSVLPGRDSSEDIQAAINVIGRSRYFIHRENDRSNYIVEFHGCNFRRFNFEGLLFREAIFKDCKFLDCNLSMLDASSCDFTKCEFDRSDFMGVLLSGAAFKDCSFRNLIIESPWLDQCTFMNSNFERVAFRSANHNSTFFYSCDFTTSQICASDFSCYSSISENNISDTIFKNCAFLNLTTESSDYISIYSRSCLLISREESKSFDNDTMGNVYVRLDANDIVSTPFILKMRYIQHLDELNIQGPRIPRWLE